MNEETKSKILKWIFDNHEHHAWVPPHNPTYDDEEPICQDGDEPYVNSLALERFIKTL